MNKDNLYPVKYAILEVQEQVGWTPGLNELQRDYGAVANIVSKVYIVSDTTNYIGDGTSRKSYNVVFPYSVGYDLGERVCPEFNFSGQCYNGDYVPQIFDTFEEAKIVSALANRELRARCAGFISTSKSDWVEQIKTAQLLFDEKLKKYLDLEELIESQTSDMVVGSLKLEKK